MVTDDTDDMLNRNAMAWLGEVRGHLNINVASSDGAIISEFLRINEVDEPGDRMLSDDSLD